MDDRGLRVLPDMSSKSFVIDQEVMMRLQEDALKVSAKTERRI